MACRKSRVDGEGLTAMADALEAVTTLTSLNGCDRYAAIRAGGLSEVVLDGEWELAVAVARYLPRSGATLGRLDLRCCPTAHSARPRKRLDGTRHVLRLSLSRERESWHEWL